MATKVQITFDARDAYALAAWWAGLLGYELEDVHDVVAGLLEQGVVTEADVMRVDGRLYFDGVVTARDPDGVAPRFYVQQVPEGKTAKNRLHLDVPIGAEELEAAVDRVVASGATLVEYRSHPGERWAVMQDPEGNEFCLH
ncbi:MAG: VOC family protein [Acidimicrobiia bacterium]